MGRHTTRNVTTTSAGSRHSSAGTVAAVVDPVENVVGQQTVLRADASSRVVVENVRCDKHRHYLERVISKRCVRVVVAVETGSR